jgi:hypothetical protein
MQQTGGTFEITLPSLGAVSTDNPFIAPLLYVKSQFRWMFKPSTMNFDSEAAVPTEAR